MSYNQSITKLYEEPQFMFAYADLISRRGFNFDRTSPAVPSDIEVVDGRTVHSPAGNFFGHKSYDNAKLAHKIRQNINL